MDRHLPLATADRVRLLTLAVAVVRSGIERRPVVNGATAGESRALHGLGASFVTLERDDDLLGCIGTIEPVRPLFEDVMQNAYRSAFADPRLPSVTTADYRAMVVKVSVLSPLEPVEAADRAALVAALRPGIDGLVIDDGTHRATFLPSVWARVPTADEFVDLLWRKAQLSTGRWRRGLRAWRYTTDEFADPGPRAEIRPGSASAGRRCT